MQGVGFRSQAIWWSHSRYRDFKERCHGNHFFGFLYMGSTLAPPDKYDWTVRVWRRCGLMSNYFGHLLLLLLL